MKKKLPPSRDASNGKRLRRRGGERFVERAPFSAFISNEDPEGARPFICRRLGDRTRFPGLSLKLSVRYIENYKKQCSRMFSVPYITKSGKISAHTLVRAEIHPVTFIATIASTVFKRIQNLLLSRKSLKPRDIFAKYKILFKLCVVYALSWNNSLIDRVLGCTKRKVQDKVLRSIFKRKFAELSDSQRFVYSQVYNQTNWLTSRSERPRDKLSVKDKETAAYLYFGVESCRCKEYDCPYGSLLYTWNPMSQESEPGSSSGEELDWAPW